jgi:hypothetical protein
MRARDVGRGGAAGLMQRNAWSSVWKTHCARDAAVILCAVAARGIVASGLGTATLDLTTQAAPLRVPIAPSPALAPAVIATWHGRMVNEHGSAQVFEDLAGQLAAIGHDADAREARTFAAEERRHGAQCGAVVQSAGGRAVAEVSAGRRLPAHADTTPRAAVARNVVSICCLAETIAVALIGAERLDMPDGALRDLLTQIWSDEVGHARFGWRYLARELPHLDDVERDAVARYLPVAFAAIEQHELAHLPTGTTWPAEAAAYGLCSGDDARVLLYETLTEVIVPQLEALGLPAARAWQQRRSA